MGMSALGLWYACAFGTVVFATDVPLRRVPVAAAAAAFAVGAWWVVPDGVVAVALGAAAIAAWGVSGRLPPMAAALAAGALAGVWTGQLGSQGLPWALAALLAASGPVLSCVMTARRPDFAPRAVRDESLLIVGALGVLAAAAPTVVEGWRAAGNLALQSHAPDVQALMPEWALTLTGTAAALGGLSAIWSRR